jgi:O-antigen/teichoic acid export membrane protein
MTGTVVAQTIPIILSPILTRLYSPEAYGLFAIYSSAIVVLAVICTGRYELSIMLPKEDKDAVNLGALTVSTNLAASILFLLIVCVFNKLISEKLGNPAISPWLYLMPLSMVIIGSYQTLNFWVSRKKLYRKIASSKLWQAVSTGIANLCFGLTGIGAAGLILGGFIGQIVSAAVLGCLVWREDSGLRHLVSKEQMKKNAIVYKNFPQYSLPTALLDSCSNNLPVFILAHLFSNNVAGFYALALKTLGAPMGFIGDSISQVFYQQFAEHIDSPEKSRSLLIKTWKHLALIALLPMLIILLFGQNIFTLVFGVQWGDAGRIASILAPMFYLIFISSPTSSTYNVLGMQKAGFIFGLTSIAGRPAALLAGAKYSDVFFGLKCFVAFEICQIILFNVLLVHRLKRN